MFDAMKYLGCVYRGEQREPSSRNIRIAVTTSPELYSYKGCSWLVGCRRVEGSKHGMA